MANLLQQFWQNLQNSTSQAGNDLSYAVDPAHIVSDMARIPTLPSSIATLMGHPYTPSQTVQNLGQWSNDVETANRTEHDIPDPISIGADGKMHVDYGRLARQEGPLALLPTGEIKAATTAAKSTQMASKLLNHAVGVLSPGVQGSYKVGAAVQGGIALGVPAAMAAVVNSQPAQADDGATVTENPNEVVNLDLNNNLIDEPVHPVAVTTNPTEQVHLDPDKELNIFQSHPYFTVGAGLLAAAAGHAALTSKMAGIKELDRINNSIITGEAQANPALQRSFGTKVAQVFSGSPRPAPTFDKLTVAGGLTDTKTAVTTQTMDRFAPIVNGLQNLAGASQAKVDDLINRLYTTASAHAMGSKTLAASQSGQLPHTSMRTSIVDRMMNDYKSLDGQSQATLDDAMGAATRLDDIRAGKRILWESTDPRVNYSDTDLSAIVAKARQDTRLAKLMDEHKQLMSDLVDYRVQRGSITKELGDKFKRENPNYSSLSKNFINDNRSLLGHNGGPQLDDLDPFMAAREHDIGKGVAAGEIKSPFAMLPHYFGATLAHTERNTLRRDIVHLMADHDPMNSVTGDRLFTRAANSDKGHDVIEFFHNGGLQRWKINDPGIASALKFSPQNLSGILNTIRRVSQFNQTGITNLPFAGKSATMNTIDGYFNIPPHLQGGILTEILTRLGVPIKLGRLDPTIPANPVFGATRILAARASHAASQAIDQSLRQNGPLSTMIGKVGSASGLRDILQRAYENSQVFKAQQGGGLTARWGKESADVLENGVNSTSFIKNVGKSPPSRAVMAVLEAIQKSNEIQARAIGDAKGMAVTSPQINKLNKEVRELFGDPSLMGGDPNTQVGQQMHWGWLNAGDYTNVGLQAAAASYRGFMKNKAKVAGVVVAVPVMLAANLAAMPKEALRSWYQDYTPQQRAQSIPIPIGNGKIWPMVVPPTIRPLVSLTHEGLGAIFGLHDNRSFDSGHPIFRKAHAHDDLDVAWANLKDGETAAIGSLVPNVTDTGNTIGHGLQAAVYGAKALGGVSSTNEVISQPGFFNESPTVSHNYDPVTGDQDGAALRSAKALSQDLFGVAANATIAGWGAAHEALHGTGGHGDLMEASKDFTDAFLEPYDKTANSSLPQHLVFGNNFDPKTSMRLGENNTMSDMLKVREDNIDRMVRQYSFIDKHKGEDHYGARQSLTDQDHALLQEAQLVSQQIHHYRELMKKNYRELDAFKASHAAADKEVRDATIRRHDEATRALNEHIHDTIREREIDISRQLGRPFSFTDRVDLAIPEDVSTPSDPQQSQ